MRRTTAVGSTFWGTSRSAASQSRTTDRGDVRGRSSEKVTCTRALRITLPVAIAVGLGAAGTCTPASAAPPDTCNVTGVVAHALPATVNIRVVKVIRGTDAGDGKLADVHIDVATGSGAIIDSSGVIVTNRHVIQDAVLIQVTFSDKRQVAAQLIGAGALIDLALLKVDVPEPLPVLQFGDSDTLQLGQSVIAVGDPLGIGTSVSTGVVSGLDRNLMRSPFDDFIQTDATINPGNSGGPLFDCAGDIIGINSALLSNSKLLGSIGLGFALPSNDVQFVAHSLRNPQTDMPNWIGLHLQDVTARLAAVFGQTAISGAIVTRTDQDGPAARASLAPGDIITGADGHELPDARAIQRYVLLQPPSAPISLTVWRHGRTSQVTLRAQPWPHIMALRSEVLPSPADVARVTDEGIGLHLTAISEANRKQFGLTDDRGVLVDQIIPGSQADEAGLKPGDVIEQVDDHPPRSPEVVTAQLRYGDTAAAHLTALLVHTATETRWVTLYVGRVDVMALLAMPLTQRGPELARDASAPAQRQ
jgi:serine protease Do